MGEISLKAVAEEENIRTFHIGLTLGEGKALWVLLRLFFNTWVYWSDRIAGTERWIEEKRRTREWRERQRGKMQTVEKIGQRKWQVEDVKGWISALSTFCFANNLDHYRTCSWNICLKKYSFLHEEKAYYPQCRTKQADENLNMLFSNLLTQVWGKMSWCK